VAALLDEGVYHSLLPFSGVKGEIDHAVGGIGPGEPLEIDVLPRLFIKPDEVEGLALPLGASLIVALETERRVLRLIPTLNDARAPFLAPGRRSMQWRASLGGLCRVRPRARPFSFADCSSRLDSDNVR